jgi:hypothetical protein
MLQEVGIALYTAYLTLTLGEWGGGCHELVQFEVTEIFCLKSQKTENQNVYIKKTPFENSPL